MNIWRPIEGEHILFEITPLCWGAGFDIGYVYRIRISIWLGPIYIELGI